MTIVINILLAIVALGLLGFIFGVAGSVKPREDGETVCNDSGIIANEEMKTHDEKLCAFVKCGGVDSERRYTYVGAPDCVAAALLAGGPAMCEFACLGLGTCLSVCKHGAISTDSGVAVVDATKCTGCGECVKACPRAVIELVPADAREKVCCNNRELGSKARKACDLGCIGCFACVKNCNCDAIEVSDSLAVINYDKCIRCGECATACPRGTITAPVAAKVETEDNFDESEYFSLDVGEEEAVEEK